MKRSIAAAIHSTAGHHTCHVSRSNSSFCRQPQSLHCLLVLALIICSHGMAGAHFTSGTSCSRLQPVGQLSGECTCSTL